MSKKDKKVVIPLLQIQGDASKKKTLRQGRRNYYTHKMGAGYKSRCSDLERWQQYSANEFRWASAATNFTCPYQFIAKDSPEDNSEKETENQFPELSKLNDKSIKADDKIRFITLGEFGVKKISSPAEMKSYEEWEANMRHKAFSKRKNKGDNDNSKPKLKTQRSKLFQSLPSNSSSSKSDNAENQFSDLVVHKNPLYFLARDKIGVMEKLAKILEFRRMRFEEQIEEPSAKHSMIHEGLRTSVQHLHLPGLELDPKKKKRSLRRSLREHLVSPRGHKSTEYNSLSPYRTDKKRKRQSAEVRSSPETPLSARLPEEESPHTPTKGRNRAATTVLEPPFMVIFDEAGKPGRKNLAASSPEPVIKTKPDVK